jgi:hypothetical protein
VYYYPVTDQLNLNRYNDVTDIEIEFQVIKQHIFRNRAEAISPEKIINIWIVDMIGTSILGFSSFPWETIDGYHGIVVHQRCFFPEDYNEQQFSGYKTFTHEIGHFFGLLHVFSNNSGLGAYAAINLNLDEDELNGDYIADTPTQLTPTYNPTDKERNRLLHYDNDFNPLFMNFMDYTHDKYVSMFTKNQIQKMRYMIFTYYPGLNDDNELPLPKYDPITNSIDLGIHTVEEEQYGDNQEEINDDVEIKQDETYSDDLLEERPSHDEHDQCLCPYVNPPYNSYEAPPTMSRGPHNTRASVDSSGLGRTMIVRKTLPKAEPRKYSKYSSAVSGTRINSLDTEHNAKVTTLKEAVAEKKIEKQRAPDPRNYTKYGLPVVNTPQGTRLKKQNNRIYVRTVPLSSRKK